MSFSVMWLLCAPVDRKATVHFFYCNFYLGTKNTIQGKEISGKQKYCGFESKE